MCSSMKDDACEAIFMKLPAAILSLEDLLDDPMLSC